DFSGNLFIADTSYHRILSFALLCPSPTTTTTQPPTSSQNQICATAVWNQTSTVVAGITSSAGTTTTLLYNPSDIHFDGYGNMYVADRTNHRIHLFRSGQTIGTTVAGTAGSAGNTYSQLNNPYGIFVSSNKTMFILDTLNYRVLRWQLGDPLGYVIAGGNSNGGASNQIGTSYGIFVDDQYNVYVSESSNHRVTLWSNHNRTAGALVAGGNGQGNANEKLNSPWGVYVDANRTVYVADLGNHRVQRWDAGSGTGVTVAGSTSSAGPWAYQLNNPTSIILDPYGYLYVLDSGNSRVQRWFPGDSYGRTVISATMSSPSAIKIDLLGNFVIADTSYHRVLSFGLLCPGTTTTTSPPPTVTTIPLCSAATWNSTSTTAAGSQGTTGSTATLLYYPYDVDFDSYNYMYVVDYSNHRIQRFPPGSNTAATVAGSTGSPGSTLAQLNNPSAIYVTANQIMYIMDTSNYRVLKWKLGDPLGYIVAGGNGNGGAFTQIGTSYSLFVDSHYNIYISEQTNHRVTKWSNGNTTAGALIAGGNGQGNTPDKLNYPWGIYVDSSSTLYVADRSNNRIQRWDSGAANGITVAGDTSGTAGSFSYLLNSPTGVMVDQYGSIYVLDSGNTRIQKWTSGATFGTTVLTTTLSNPLGMGVNAVGNLFIADTNSHRVQSFSVYCPVTTTSAPLSIQVSTPLCSTAVWNSSVTLIVGATGTSGNSPTFVSSPYDVTFDKYQQMYVADYGNHRIQQYTFGSNVGQTVAGITSSAGSTLGQLNNPSAVYVDANDNMYILDTSNYRILRWELGNQLGTIIVNGRGSGTTLDKIGTSYAMFVFNATSIYVSEYGNNRVTKWIISNNNLGQLMAGGAGVGSTSEKLNGPWGIYVDINETLYVADRLNHRIQKWVFGSPIGITIAGQSGVLGSWSYQFNNPTSLTFDQYGYMYVLDAGNSRVQKWSIGMTYGFTVVSGSMSSPSAMHWDFSNNIYVADTSSHRIMSYNILCPPTTTTTVASSTLPPNAACQSGVYNATWSIVAGVSSATGTTSIHLNSPTDVFVDGNFNIYVADYGNSRIQKYKLGVFAASSTVAGYTLAGGSSYSELYNPTSVYVDLNGIMYIADASNYRVQKVLPNQPLGFTVAGGRGNGSTLDKIGLVYSVFVDNQGNIYVSEYSNHRVTLWLPNNASAGQLAAGIGVLGSSSVHLNSPWGIHVDSNSTLYVVDRGNHRVQQWIRGNTYGITIAGTTSTSGSSSSLLNSPTAITFDSNFNM
ncbi:unnamed protein product, partial [Rotaria sp. Silwood1]